MSKLKRKLEKCGNSTEVLEVIGEVIDLLESNEDGLEKLEQKFESAMKHSNGKKEKGFWEFGGGGD